MGGESEPDRMLCRQDTVWPPPPDVPFVASADTPQCQPLEAVSRSLRWAALLFTAGCVAPFACWIFFVLMLKAPPAVAKFESACIWPVLYTSAVYYGGKACFQAVRAHRPGSVVQGVLVIALSLVFIGIWFRLYL